MPIHTDASQVYDVMRLFEQRCLRSNGSLLWDDLDIWTPDHVSTLVQHFVNAPDESDRSFWEKLAEQLSGLPQACYKIMADAFVIYALPSTFILPETKWGFVARICRMGNLDEPDAKSPISEALSQGFTRTSQRYHAKVMQLWIILLMAKELKHHSDPDALLDDSGQMAALLDNCLNDIDPTNRAYDMRHALLHMLFPNEFERIISNEHKARIAATYQDYLTLEAKQESIDHQLLLIRERLQAERDGDSMDFYAPEFKRQWLDEIARPAPGGGGDEEPDDTPPLDPLLEQLSRPLIETGQLILYGPPGTGKTYYARRLAETIIANNNFDKADASTLTAEERATLRLDSRSDESQRPSYLRMCTFHPGYGYEEFVEGYRPGLSESGTPYFQNQDGIFKRLCQDARKEPDRTFVLIIDEINRGNIPRIFGELITLIERDKRWRPDDPHSLSVELPISREAFSVPERVYIIATMNTADKSIAVLDTALRRRFAFRELLPDPQVLGGIVVNDIPLDKLLVGLNERIVRVLNRNLQIGHAYFLDAKGEPVKTPTALATVLRDKVLPLLQDYCYDDYAMLRDILGTGLVDEARQRFHPEILDSKGESLLLELVGHLVNIGLVSDQP